MNFKIIETDSPFPDVLIYRDENDAGESIAVIRVWGWEPNETTESLISEVIEFENSETTKSFIEDFSSKSAENWCESREIKYSMNGDI